MAKRAYELLVRFGKDESVAGAHIKEMHLDENGNDLRETPPVPLEDTTNPAFTAFADKFSAKAVAENEVLKGEKAALEAEKATLESQLATKTELAESLAEDKATLQAEKTDLVAQVATLTSEKSALTSQVASITQQLESSNSQIETLTDEKAELVASLTAANNRIAALLQEIPFNPRILKGEAFYNRVSKEDMVTLLTSENPQLVVVGKTIEAYRANKWPVVLDSDDFQQLVGYVLQSGVFDEQEVLAIMTDATREEAYGTE